jgi:hypothetical protein
MVFLIDHYGVTRNVSNIIGGCDLCKNVNLTFDISHLSIFVFIFQSVNYDVLN